ncbi:MAG: hypothetical protein JOY95_03095 [Silvibacterium sp.]|nr:hypothetical protein [Silvibacterium sp.]
MNISDPIVLEKDFLLCEVDQALAHAFLQDAVRAVKNAGDEDTRDLQSAVIKSMLVFHQHREACEECKAA